ncbi:MAG: YicC/YloC family endoribonuclease [Pseudomonadota bacterium]
MALSSMTGFARTEGVHEGVRWVWEVRSVNGKGLDLRLRLPSGFESLEAPLRTLAQNALKRGSLQASLQVRTDAAQSELAVNEAALAQVLGLMKSIGETVAVAPPRAEAILALRGVLETRETGDEAAREATLAALKQGFEQTLESLVAARKEEGARLAALTASIFDEIEALVLQASGEADGQVDAIRDRLAKTLADLGGPDLVAEDRIAQEIVLLAAKADVREELDRLRIHLNAGRDLLKSDNAVGRKLDFLVQEFHREANTLCSKSADAALTASGLELKGRIDQLREQVQNIE